MTTPKLKVDRFTIILVVILVICAGMLVISFRASFNAFTTAYDVNGDSNTDLKINEAKLDEALQFVFGQKTIVPLNIKNSTTVPVATGTVTVTPRPSVTPVQ